MHITEGILTGVPALATTGVGVALMAWGTARMKRFAAQSPGKKPLLGMGGALVFFFSLIPVPAFTGTCTHPCGTPLVAILLGPTIGMALAGISLLLQAAFFAHGGFGTWGANILALGFVGCFSGWGAFRAARKLGLPLWAAGFAGGLIGDLAVYAASALILAATLAHAPSPQYSFEGYLLAVAAAYLPTQLPIAVGEMLITGLALQNAYRQRPEVLEELGVVSGQRGRWTGGSHAPVLSIVLLLSLLLQPAAASARQLPQTEPTSIRPSTAATTGERPLTGLDERVNEALAERAGIPVLDPFLNTEALGELWNTLLLLAGGVCGFILGRWWHLLWGSKRENAH